MTEPLSDSQCPLVSVLMPAYNHERYVETAIRSVLDQDWPRIELIVLDDGSVDGTWRVLEGLRGICESRLERVVFLRQENRGTCETTNRLCALATGGFVGLLASDDAYAPGALSALVRPMLDDPSVGVTVGQNELMDADGNRCFWDADRRCVQEKKAVYRTFNEYLRERRRLAQDGSDFGRYAKLLEANHVANGALIRRLAIDRVLPFRDDAPLEDLWLHLQLAKVTCYREVGDTTFRYRWHAGNTARQRARMAFFTAETYRTEERLLFSDRNVSLCREYLQERGVVRRKRGNALLGRRVIETSFSQIVEWRLIGLRWYCRRPRGKGRTLVVAHVFYPKLWPELAACIRNIGGDRKVVITYSDSAAVETARRDFPDATFLRCENRGYDVWPFLKALQTVDVNDFEYVVKLHTKRDVPVSWYLNGTPLGGSRWRRLALHFAATPADWRKTLRTLRRPEIGLVADRHLIFGRETTEAKHYPIFDLAYENIRILTGRSAFGGSYVAGTMFAAKTAALRPLFSQTYSADMFEETCGHGGVTQAHMMEREFGMAVEAVGLRVASFDE